MVVNEKLFDSPEITRSRRAYCMESTFEYFVTIFVGGSFLAKLLSSMGFSDALIGVISSFVSLAFLFQLFSVFVVQRITNTKRFVILFHTLGQLFFMGLYLIPFLPFPFKHKQALVVLCVLAAYFGNYFVTSILYRWGNSNVSPTKRGAFSSVKEMISLLSGMVVTLVLGYVMDAFEASDHLEGSFVFAAVGILIFCMCDFICLLLIKNDIRDRREKREVVPMREVMRNTLGNRNFRTVVILTVLWDVLRYLTTGFLGVYQIGELAFSMGVIQIINMASHFARAGISKPFGRFSDKHSYATGVRVALIIAAAAFLCLIFTTPTTRYLIVGYTVLMSVSAAGTNANLLNITYSYVDEKYFVQASAIKNSIGGLCGFGASLVGSRILARVQANGNTLFGIHVYGQQVLAAISLVLLVAAILFVYLVIEKQKRMVQ